MADFPKTRQIIPVMYLPVADLSSFFQRSTNFQPKFLFLLLVKEVISIYSYWYYSEIEKKRHVYLKENKSKQ